MPAPTRRAPDVSQSSAVSALFVLNRDGRYKKPIGTTTRYTLPLGGVFMLNAFTALLLAFTSSATTPDWPSVIVRALVLNCSDPGATGGGVTDAIYMPRP